MSESRVWPQMSGRLEFLHWPYYQLVVGLWVVHLFKLHSWSFLSKTDSIMLSCSVDKSLISGVWLFMTLWTIPWEAPLSMGLPRQEYWSGLHFLLQGIFLTVELNPHLLHCKAQYDEYCSNNVVQRIKSSN